MEIELVLRGSRTNQETIRTAEVVITVRDAPDRVTTLMATSRMHRHRVDHHGYSVEDAECKRAKEYLM